MQSSTRAADVNINQPFRDSPGQPFQQELVTAGVEQCAGTARPSQMEISSSTSWSGKSVQLVRM